MVFLVLNQSFSKSLSSWDSFRTSKNDFGVPQGSALGPSLFIMYINGISHVVRYSNVEQYADDTLLYFASDNVNIIESNLSSDLESVTQWLSANYLILNSTKSKIMLVGTHQRLASKSFSISSNGRDLERSEKFKYLGVFMDPTLSWKSHINYLGKKISSRLGMLCRAQKILPQSSCITLYNAMILPLFDYCSVVWYSCGLYLKDILISFMGVRRVLS